MHPNASIPMQKASCCPRKDSESLVILRLCHPFVTTISVTISAVRMRRNPRSNDCPSFQLVPLSSFISSTHVHKLLRMGKHTPANNVLLPPSQLPNMYNERVMKPVRSSISFANNPLGAKTGAKCKQTRGLVVCTAYAYGERSVHACRVSQTSSNTPANSERDTTRALRVDILRLCLHGDHGAGRPGGSAATRSSVGRLRRMKSSTACRLMIMRLIRALPEDALPSTREPKRECDLSWFRCARARRSRAAREDVGTLEVADCDT